ncbi:MAG: DNA-binding protein [Flavobacterium nitrogenifigens]|uniref:HTH-type transcriptional regulator / antitoxin HigA n=1 Tax=Flavobacterium nitrogenifigens TaxID=1617283 RepID=A0A521CBF6_9FLAO|nr:MULTISPECIES: DNA-binding protein [Flavobacterium]KAF2327040.1 DNA-binding protein [Flavobacterium nitrogenifigens]MDQ8011408.1 DNA-binding protein [Flavobacterium nitrogenifigens]WDF63955.1 DNA-binding protein [Flavobacterium sp. KACC 22763]SMO56746.1 HTH-type transcriptional regulator / antitoxin HigA [Flavobacterium nitrogenifigens]
MNIKPIKTEHDYSLALERVNFLFDAKPDTAEGDELDILVTLIEKYEQIHYPIPEPDPIEAIKFMMEQNGLSDADLGIILNSRSRVSELFNRKRALTIKQIRVLTETLHIPASTLIKEYALNQ